MKTREIQIAIIGLGYVGLPLAVEFAKKYSVIGFDINDKRVTELKNKFDKTLEVSKESLEFVIIKESEESKKIGLLPTTNIDEISNANIFIVTVPTPTDKHNRPVLSPILSATKKIGSILKSGDIVIYESTVYPGVTEEECVPVLAKISGLVYNVDFFVGYSPERINPGDKKHTVANILKVTSGSTPEIAKQIDDLYKSIILAGTFMAKSIKVAEAAKVIENSQRDINIAFVNELSKIFNLLGIDTNSVLEAASTKWNFINFKPGLVGGHCIGVDPYYLAQKAQEVGYHPEIILAGRRLNDGMGKYIANEVIKKMLKKGLQIRNSNVLILGMTFKENCPDIRNTKVIDIFNELLTYDLNVDVYDPWANLEETKLEYGINILRNVPILNNYSAIILAVAHDAFLDLHIESSEKVVVYDVKGILPVNKIDGRL
jgi:UDP-N-acetyl-D-galactosamine dehydrogenase